MCVCLCVWVGGCVGGYVCECEYVSANMLICELVCVCVSYCVCVCVWVCVRKRGGEVRERDQKTIKQLSLVDFKFLIK